VITLTGVLRLPIFFRLAVSLAGLGLTGSGRPALAAPRSATARARRANERTGRLTPAFSELMKAHRHGDRSALGRLADKIGTARLAIAIAAPDEHLAAAALAAAELARGGISLLAPITAELASANPARAAAAAGALGSLLDGSVPTALEDWEVPPDEVALACGGLLVLAVKSQAAIPARLAALDALLSSAASCGPAGDLTPLARDPVPAIRRAALLVAAGGARHESISKDAVSDTDRSVSAAAVATACRFEGRRAASGHETPPPAQVVATARLLATAQTTPAEDAVEMLDCLAAAATPADRALLDDLRRGPPSPLRDRAVELGDLAARGRGE
jgi:hypothetical protein